MDGSSLQACAFWRLARGVELYEQKRFKDAEEELRALLSILPADSPGRPFAKCRLADTLYGRAVSLNSMASHSSGSSTPASAGEVWVDPVAGEVDVEAEQVEVQEAVGEVVEEEVEVVARPYSPLSPARDLMRSSSGIQDLTSSTASTPQTPQPATPQLWTNSWTPPLEEAEAPDPPVEEVRRA